MSLKLTHEFKTNSWVKRLIKGTPHNNVPLDITRNASVEVAKEWKRIAINRASAGTGKTTLSRRSGGLVRSIEYRTKKIETGLNIALRFAFYGMVHENGAIITPKRAKYLVFHIPGVGWRKSRRVIIPQRRWASKSREEATKQFPEIFRRMLKADMEKHRDPVSL